MIAAISDLLARYRWWLLAALLVTLFAVSRSAALQTPEAILLALAVPVSCTALTLRFVPRVRRSLAVAALALSCVSLLGAELLVGRTLFPPAALAEATVSLKAPDATLSVPEGAGRFLVEAHGRLADVRGTADGHYQLELERAGGRSIVSGDFEKSSSPARVSRRRAPSSGSAHLQDVDRHEIELAGSGPIHAHLSAVSGAIGKSLDVRIRPPNPGGGFLEDGLVALTLAAFGLDLLAARSRTPTDFTSLQATSVALALYLPGHFSPSDALAGVIGALMVAVIAGAGVRWLSRQSLARLARIA